MAKFQTSSKKPRFFGRGLKLGHSRTSPKKSTVNREAVDRTVDCDLVLYIMVVRLLLSVVGLKFHLFSFALMLVLHGVLLMI